MKVLVFAKRQKTFDGRTWFKFLGTMRKKSGEDEVVQVRFRDECGNPSVDKCPCYLSIDKENANLSRKTYTDKDTGERHESWTLWVNDWVMLDEPYVDTSLDEFED